MSTLNRDVYIDQTLTLRRIIVNNGGRLICPTGSTQNITLTITEIIVQKGGEFRCGTSTNRVQGKIKFNFRQYSDGYNQRRILVQGGTLNLHGDDSRNDWRMLSADASASMLYFSENTNWHSDDYVVVGSSTMAIDGHKVRKLTSKTGNNWGLSRSLSLPTASLHHGDSSYTLRNGVSLSSGGAAVGNLKRNLVISGDNCSYTGNGELTPVGCENSSNGVDIAIMKSGSTVPQARIDSVEIAFGGRSGVMGRYPVHWHQVGSASGQYIKNSVIHNSKNRCIVVHGTNNLLVNNNFCFNHQGHGIFLEDGNETENTITNNLVIHSTPANYPLLESERSCDSNNGVHCTTGRWASPSSIWISNPKNIVTGNVVSGSHGVGFWMSFPKTEFSGKKPVFTRTPNNYFKENRASSSVIGFTWDGLETNGAINSNHYSPRDTDNCSSANHEECISNNDDREKPTFSRLVAYKNREAGIYFRGDAALFEESILADNKWSYFVAYSQELRLSIIMGMSDKMTTYDKDWVKNHDPERFGGVVAYDGPYFINTVDFNDFESTTHSGVDITPYPFFGIGGTRKYINMTQGLRFGNLDEARVKFDFSSSAWRDAAASTVIKDLDGSLVNRNGASNTHKNKYILADENYNNKTDCDTSPARMNHVMVCPSKNNYVGYRFAVLNSSSVLSNNSYVWFDVRETDYSTTSRFEPNYGGGGKGINKVTVLSYPTYDGLYNRHLICPRNETADSSVFNFPNQNFLDQGKFRIYASTIGVLNSPAKLRIQGKTNCTVLGGSKSIAEASSWSQFNNTSGNVFFNHNTGLYVKMTGETWHPWHKEITSLKAREDYVDFSCMNSSFSSCN
ncbi:MAG: G8 domain-containing protein [Bdellovibrionota bacterium]|nr:G8 domain-containing protein [Bdellovibrionota bacterium]